MIHDDDLDGLAAVFRAALEADSTRGGKGLLRLPSMEAVRRICRVYLELLFPIFHRRGGEAPQPPGAASSRLLDEFKSMMEEQIVRAKRLAALASGGPDDTGGADDVRGEVNHLIGLLPELGGLMTTDLEAAFRNDPAAADRQEVLLSYPCMEAITIQRLANRLYRMGIPYIPRMMTEAAHGRTGIDIHPGAAIGESFFIDHGTGVVIGETSTIGNNVTLYHGVTLGAFNPMARDDRGDIVRGARNKRHPDLEDHVTVYPGATILGGGTRVGHHSVIGGNVWLTHSVPPYSRVTIPQPDLVFLDRSGAAGIGEGI